LTGRREPLRAVSRRCASAQLAALCFAVCALGSAACTVPQDAEVAIGQADAAKADSQMPMLQDSMADQFVTKLGLSMASKTSRADLTWHFAVVNTPEVNAFALPGGFIFVNRGAIEQADRFDQLAGVMGHEIGHVVQRHSVKQMQKRAAGDAAIIAVCTLTRVCRTLGGQVLVGINADAMAARYSQHDEAQADSEGVVNTLRAGIDPEGLPSFFQKLLDQQKVQPDAFQAFFSTHPTDQARVTATRQQIAEVGVPVGTKLTQDTPEFRALQAHLRALPPPPKPATQ
jgi:predicted Zn-dependent protease